MQPSRPPTRACHSQRGFRIKWGDSRKLLSSRKYPPGEPEALRSGYSERHRGRNAPPIRRLKAALNPIAGSLSKATCFFGFSKAALNPKAASLSQGHMLVWILMVQSNLWSTFVITTTACS
jgi:hypothetical protein